MNLFDTKDLVIRILVFFSMFGVIGLGITGDGQFCSLIIVLSIQMVTFLLNLKINQIQGESGALFGRGYSSCLLWARAFVELLYLSRFSIKKARKWLLIHFAIFLIDFSFLIASIFVFSANLRLILRTVGVVFDLLGGFFFTRISAKSSIGIPLNLEHIVERIALFTMIIIGEPISSLVFRLDSNDFIFKTWISLFLGCFLTFCLQFLFFEIENSESNQKELHAMNRGAVISGLWMHFFIPLHLSILMLAAGLFNVVESTKLIYFETISNATLFNNSCFNLSSNLTINDSETLFRVCSDVEYYSRLILLTGSAGTLLFLSLSGILHLRQTRAKILVFWTFFLRLTSVLFLMLISLLGNSISLLSYLAIVCGVYFINVVLTFFSQLRIRKERKSLQIELKEH